MLQNAILSGISQLSPLDGPANSDLVRENVNSLKGGESAYQVAASLEKWNFLQYNLIRNRTYKFNNPSFIFDQWSTNPWRKCGHELYLALSCRVNIISFLLVDPTTLQSETFFRKVEIRLRVLPWVPEELKWIIVKSCKQRADSISHSSWLFYNEFLP